MPDKLDGIIAPMLPNEPTTSGRTLLRGGLLSEGFECANEAIQAEVEGYTQKLSALFQHYDSDAAVISESI